VEKRRQVNIRTAGRFKHIAARYSQEVGDPQSAFIRVAQNHPNQRKFPRHRLGILYPLGLFGSRDLALNRLSKGLAWRDSAWGLAIALNDTGEL
jgi:hypothetical protein